MPRAVALAAVAALVAVTAGCAREDDGRTSPATGERQRAQCVVSDPQGEVIVHPGSITPETDLVLDDVALDEAVGLEVVERDVVAFTGNSAVQGVVQDYPPLKKAGLADSLASWSQRVPLPGARLRPSDGQQAVLVALRLADPAEAGHLDGVTLTLTEDGEQREVAMSQPLLVQPPDAPCDVAAYESTEDWAPQERR